MKLYVIKMPDGTYFAQNKSKNDNAFKYTKDIKDAEKYISPNAIERAVGSLKYIFKGAAIIDLDTMKIVKHIRGYIHTLENVQVFKETEKAIMIQNGIWLPRSHIENLVDTSSIGISAYMWLEKFSTITNETTIDMDTITEPQVI